MKKLYTVTVESEIVVLADSPEDAEYNAERWAREDSFDSFAKEMTHLPNDWDLESIPYNNYNEDKTIKMLIEEGCAPEYIKAKERLEAAQNRLKATRALATAKAAEKPVLKKFTSQDH